MDAAFTSGGQCEDGLKMIFIIGEASVPPVGGDNSGGDPHGTAGPPSANSEGRELVVTAPLIETLPRNNYLVVDVSLLCVKILTGLALYSVLIL
jgi:hypothetical protein